MSTVGQREIVTQNKVIGLLCNSLGYDYLGNWKDRESQNIVENLLRQNLAQRGYGENLIRRAIERFAKKASLPAGTSLYEANRDVYDLLRYGVKVQESASENFETVWLIDWRNPETNHFGVAEEVTVRGKHTKRPDLVLYVNGIALGVIELKRSKVSVSEGIRQSIGNQSKDFIRSFFTTVQLLFAGNDVEGLRYGVIDTPEKYWLTWKEDSEIQEPLDRAILQMVEKPRFLELIHSFIVFDAGVKKICRHNQYFGVKAAQQRVATREGGIIWHTQGSGKSLTMVWLAKWIRENQENARVLIITDRTELDELITDVFAGVKEEIARATSGANLLGLLGQNNPWLMCSLVHKFRGENLSEPSAATEEFVRELRMNRAANFDPKGNLFVFVDEAHRTQSGKLHAAMKELLPDALFIGFTGTPLLRTDKAKTIEIFGSYIHTYKYKEAVKDGVVLDLRYEARDVEQRLTSKQRVDDWFESSTRNMTDLNKLELKKRWARIKEIESSEPRAKIIASDILMDMDSKPRLMDGRGNAILVCSSVYQACKFYEIFSQSELAGKVAVITSYVPTASSIALEHSGAGSNEEVIKYRTYRAMLADYLGTNEDDAVKRISEFEKDVKAKFIKDPGQMRLLIVVDKLLTGFDAPSATYLYIDKKMQDHGLFQAICRVNRLDGDDKEFGYIIDYKDLFNSINRAVVDYTSGALDGYDAEDIEGLLKDSVKDARKRLEEALEYVEGLCEPVQPPRNSIDFQHYFCCIESGNSQQLKDNEPKRIDLYKGVAKLVRAFAGVAIRTDEAGYSAEETEKIRKKVKFFSAVRDEVKLGAGENLDFKQFEAGMRRILDTYVVAEGSRVLESFNQGLVGLIAEQGEEGIAILPPSIRNDKKAVAETIENNVRTTIVDEEATNPKYYDQLSKLLDNLIEKRRQETITYEAYLKELVELAKKIVKEGISQAENYPAWANTPARRALVDFSWPESQSDNIRDIYSLIQREKEHGWASSTTKRRALKFSILRENNQSLSPEEVDELLELLEKHNEFQ